jgi:hypothetical protein
VTERDARQGLDLDVQQCVSLGLRKVPDLRLRKLDVLDDLIGQLPMAGIDLVCAEPECVWRPPIEAFGVLS